MIKNEENKYHFAREIIFNLRACKAISAKVYLHWIDKLIYDENQDKNKTFLLPYIETELSDMTFPPKFSIKNKKK